MKKARWTNVPAGGYPCVVAQGSPNAGRAEELAVSLLAHLAEVPTVLRAVQDHTATVACRD